MDPASLKVEHFPHPALRRRAAAVPRVDDDVRAVARRMLELMREHDGIGLAATQVGLPWRLFVCFVPPAEDRSAEADPPAASAAPEVYVNPVLFDPAREVELSEEGCLSLPDIRGEVLRPREVSIRAVGLDGREFTRRASGLLARCWQHETDHLDGVLIIDKMTQMSRLKNRALVRDLERAWSEPSSGTAL